MIGGHSGTDSMVESVSSSTLSQPPPPSGRKSGTVLMCFDSLQHLKRVCVQVGKQAGIELSLEP